MDIRGIRVTSIFFISSIAPISLSTIDIAFDTLSPEFLSTSIV